MCAKTNVRYGPKADIALGCTMTLPAGTSITSDFLPIEYSFDAPIG
jgi:hypothetical protein